MQHHFNVEIATRYGVNSAIILDNMYYWIEKNRANGTNYFDGHYWTYNSKKALSELFPYLSERQVRTAIEILINDGILLTGNYNSMKLDRTLWYTITKKGYLILGDNRNCLFDLPSVSNAADSDGKAIPNNKHTDNKPDIIGPDEPNSFPEHLDILETTHKQEEQVSGEVAPRPKRNYTAKPLVEVEAENKKLTRQQKQQIKIREILQEVVPLVYGPDFYNIFGEYLDMRMNLHIGKVDKEWFQKEWDENIYPAIQKYSIEDIVAYVRTVVIPKQYKRCFININNSPRTSNFNDTKNYSASEITAAETQGRLAVEEAKRNGTFQHSF